MKYLLLTLLLSACSTIKLSPIEQKCWEHCYTKYGDKVDHSLYRNGCYCGFKDKKVLE